MVTLVVVVVSIGVDLLRIRQIKVCPTPRRGVDHPVYSALRDVRQGLPVAWSNVVDILPDLDDFGMTPLIRIVYRHEDKLDPSAAAAIQRTILGFRYWMDAPGEDSRCYWSENHQILYAAAEFLAGQKFSNEVFTNDGRLGREHQVAARRRILTWLEQRWQHGFSEWYSNNYYVFDIGALCNLIDLAEDREIVVKSQIILDLLFYDIATQSFRGNFVSTMGRAYERNRKSAASGDATRGIIQNVWDFSLPVSEAGGMENAFLFRERYQVPQAIVAIGRDTNAAVIKASQGIDLSELKRECEPLDEDGRIMLQWGMEAFTNPEAIESTMDYIKRHRLFSNSFLEKLRWADITLLRKAGLLPALSRWIDSVANGIPQQRVNTYTYRTGDCLLASAQRYHPGTLNAQHHVWSATLSDQVSIFTMHSPAVVTNAARDKNQGYWIGPGRFPDAAQHENVCLLIYRIPERTAAGEQTSSLFTHAYFPKERLDRVELRGNRIYGQLGRVHVALLGNSPLHYRADSTDDLLQDGRETTWICEVSAAKANEDFDAFVHRIEGNRLEYRAGALSYQSGARQMELRYGGDFRVNGVVQDSIYPRHESPYASTPRKASQMTIACGGSRLMLDFKNNVRRKE